MNTRKMMLGISVLAAVASVSMSSSAQEPPTSPAIIVKGLVMVRLQDRDGLRIALPNAPHHKATITFRMDDGTKRVFPFKGHGTISANDVALTRADIRVPELVQIKEIYGDGTKFLLDRAENMLLIPWSGIRKVSTKEVTAARYTFVRTDNGEEIETFRPRQVAESLRIDLTSDGAMTFNQSSIRFNSDVRVIEVEHAPQNVTSADPIQEHFHHYAHYFIRPSTKMFDVEPRKLSGATQRSPRVGNSFWVDQYIWCWLVGMN